MITKAQIGDLLTVITAIDRRTIGDADIEAWHLILGDLELADCAQAVKDHYSERRDWLMPADVHTRATGIARRRAGRARIAELEAIEAAEDEAERLAIAGADPVDRDELRSRLAALNARGHRVPRVDPRPDATRLEEARWELAAARTSAGSDSPTTTAATDLSMEGTS